MPDQLLSTLDWAFAYQESSVAHSFSALGLNTPSLVKKHASHFGIFRKSEVMYPIRGKSAQTLLSWPLHCVYAVSWVNSGPVVDPVVSLFTQECLLSWVKTFRKFLCSNSFPVTFAALGRVVCWCGWGLSVGWGACSPERSSGPPYAIHFALSTAFMYFKGTALPW